MNVTFLVVLSTVWNCGIHTSMVACTICFDVESVLSVFVPSTNNVDLLAATSILVQFNNRNIFQFSANQQNGICTKNIF